MHSAQMKDDKYFVLLYNDCLLSLKECLLVSTIFKIFMENASNMLREFMINKNGKEVLQMKSIK